MRKDNSRIKVNYKCKIIAQKKHISGEVVSLSDGGIRIKLDKFKSMNGLILDIIVHSEFGMVLTLIGSVINQLDNEIGVSILGLDKSSKMNLDKILNQKIPISLDRDVIVEQDQCRILVVGAGGGKILAQLKMLTQLEDHLGKKLLDCFNVLVGVSSGGLILSLLLKYRELKIVSNILEKLKTPILFNLIPFYSILNMTFLKKFIHQEFDCILPNSEHILCLQYRDYKTGNYESLLYQKNNFNLVDALHKSISVPVIFGLTKNYADGAVGFFVNPTEILLRLLRMRSQLLEKQSSALYLDAGFDPKFTESYQGDILSQLFWTLKMTQRDSILISVDRILNEFIELNMNSYFFTYSKNYDLFFANDIIKAEAEISSKQKEFSEWLEKNYVV
ncbi:PilZ domain-containing protein [Leptospira sp. GIMC2001]|uniref:PilZ domain-containing protein n=1 Tax=Leptospira sp. GIMC2001 TaxID=1513297 RepID=UPI0023497EA3|nr:PilZ domain-containing protein [Leptospira sp. GIMC2001]WCL49049.1 PilZ domain-containing protein [Leptospira sp. GIMC2001]